MLTDIIKEQATPVEVYQPVKYTDDPSTFFSRWEVGNIQRKTPGDTPVRLPTGQHLFLRIIPTKPLNLKGPRQILDLMNRNIGPFGHGRAAGSCHRNEFGAFSWLGQPDNGETYAITQVFRSGEVWGIDTQTILETNLAKDVPHTPRHLPIDKVEQIFEDSMKQYLWFSKKILKHSLPLRYYAGATDVKGYVLATNRGWGDEVVVPHIYYTDGIVESYDDPIDKILNHFFEFFWDECGVERFY
jgi:hypothetical protein